MGNDLLFWGTPSAPTPLLKDGRSFHRQSALILTLFLGVAVANLEWLTFVRSGFGFNDHTYGKGTVKVA